MEKYLLRAPFAARLVPVLIFVQILGAAIGLLFLERRPIALNTTLFDKFIAWDGGWYLSVARNGYQWNTSQAGTQQNIAFFPLWPLIDRICIVLFGVFFKAAIVLISWICGLASIFFFEKLARKTVPESANTATMLYCFWPASSFYLMGYPTGITNICAILALSSYFGGRVWLAAAFIGLGTAAAPTLVFAGFPIGLHYMVTQLSSKPMFIGIRNALGWTVLSLSGLFAFMLYQQLALGDALAFIKVQSAWGHSPPPLEKLARLFSFSWDLAEWRVGWHNISSGHAAFAADPSNGIETIQHGIQNLVNIVFFGFSLIGLAAGSVLIKRRRLLIMSSGCAVVAGYVWFIMLTSANMLCTPRLLFPAFAIFLGLGILADNIPNFLKAALIASFALVSLLEMAFVVAGYWVV